MAPGSALLPGTGDIFDPAHYARVRLPATDPKARSLPPWCYTAPEFFQREVDRVFMKCWNLIGRVERVTNPGDYVAFELAGAHVMVVRDRQGMIRAFANTCRHRGAKLVEEGSGQCRAIRCPYHGWVYALDGKLTGVADMEDAKDFRKEDYGLIPIRLEIWAGFMFINFDKDAPPLTATLGDLPDKIGGYRFEDMTTAFRREYDLACNWKVMIENFLEYYHTPFLHLRSVYQQPVQFLGQQSQGMVNLPIEPRNGDYVMFHMVHEGTRALMQGDTGFPPMEHLQGRLAKGTFSGSIFPAGMFSCHHDCMWFLEIYPLAVNRTKVTQVGCFPKDRLARPDFQEIAARYIKRWDLVMGEDAAMMPMMQKGLENPLAAAGPICHVEDKIHDIRRRLIDRVIGNR
jgi:choline monooxygenase